jgi:hypothetical protein
MRRKLLISPVIVGAAAIAVSAGAYAAGGGMNLGHASHVRQVSYKGFYDGHKDVYLITDVSQKAQAKSLHVNFAPALKKLTGLPPQYFVKGRAAKGQLTVFGSEPGESDYNPLWEEFFVTWKSGMKPLLLVKDDQITSLAKSGKLTLTDAHIVLNAPITKVSKSG